MKTYKQIRSELRTGDVVLFSGKGFISLVIRFLCWGNKSHMGLCVRGVGGQVSLLHSDRNKVKSGVQLTPLGAMIRAYHGRVWIRKLGHLVRGTDSPAANAAWKARFNRLNYWIEQHRTTSYESGLDGLIELLGASKLIGWMWTNKPNPLRLFCSELVADVFGACFDVSLKLPANEYEPGDFETGGSIDDELATDENRHCWLGEEVRIK